MIHITVRPNGFHIEGHAEYAEFGRDIVCASVSILAFHTSRALKRYANASIKENDNGFMEVECITSDDTAKAFLTEFNNTAKMLANQYKDNVIVTKLY